MHAKRPEFLVCLSHKLGYVPIDDLRDVYQRPSVWQNWRYSAWDVKMPQGFGAELPMVNPRSSSRNYLGILHGFAKILSPKDGFQVFRNSLSQITIHHPARLLSPISAISAAISAHHVCLDLRVVLRDFIDFIDKSLSFVVRNTHLSRCRG